jgi:hypothetical protein
MVRKIRHNAAKTCHDSPVFFPVVRAVCMVWKILYATTYAKKKKARGAHLTGGGRGQALAADEDKAGGDFDLRVGAEKSGDRTGPVCHGDGGGGD